MEPLLIEVAKQVPALVVLVWLVHHFSTKMEAVASKFLAHVESLETAHTTNIKAMEDTALAKSKVIERLVESSHDFQSDIVARNALALDKVVVAVEKNTEALGRNSAVIVRMDNILENHDKRRRPT